MIYVQQLIKRYSQLINCQNDIENAILAIENMFNKGGKLLLAGNGGSSSDCEHISGELLKGFISKRKPTPQQIKGIDEDIAQNLQLGIPCIPLTSLTALSSAFNNDVSSEHTFAQLVFGLGKENDVFLGLSTSGNAKNVCHATKVARAKAMTTICLTGEKGGILAQISDISIKVPETETFKVQELHLPVYHAICAQVEHDLFDNN